MQIKLDYELADVLELTTPEQFKALGDPLRQKTLRLLREGGATTSQLAAILGCPTSTMAHHVRVLAEAGLIRVVSTRQVRAITERYYGCTAKTYISISSSTSGNLLGVRFLQQILKEVVSLPENDEFQNYTISSTRISEAQARAFADRVLQLAKEFESMEVSGERMYSFLTAIYSTDSSDLPTDKEENSGSC